MLLGKKPQSFYATYRAWYKKFHGHDVDMAPMPPFLPPSPSNFLYDPFSVDFENAPFMRECHGGKARSCLPGDGKGVAAEATAAT